MSEYAEVIVALIAFCIPLYGVYQTNKNKIQSAERQMTTLEIEIKNLTEKVNSNIMRLNDHEAQQRLLISLTEQVKVLNQDMGELKADIKTLIRKGI